MSQGTKPALQSRSRATRDKLLKALEELLKDRTFEQISVADIARQAGLAVGTVYRRFENKEALIPVLFEIYRSRLEASFGAGVALDPSQGLRTMLRDLAARSWAFLERERAIVRETFLYARLRPDLVGEEWDALLEANIEGWRTILDLFGDEVRREPDEAAQMLAYHFNTSLTERALFGEDGVAAGMTVTEVDFTRAIADFAYGYLVTEAD